jgi:hypothetical protein
VTKLVDYEEYFVNNLMIRVYIVSSPMFNICGNIPIFIWPLYNIKSKIYLSNLYGVRY